MSVGSILIWFPSDNNKKRKEKSNIVQRLTAAERSGMFLMWHWGILRSRTTGAEGEAVCSFGQRDLFFFGLFGVAALTPASTLAALGRLCGTPWRESAGTASRTSWWEPSERLEHRTKTTMSGGKKAEQKFKRQCLFQLCNTFVFKCNSTPVCSQRVFTVVCGSAVESFRERKLPYPIHCAPPPPPARFLLSLAGNWTARHRERSDVTGQASTTETQAFNLHRSCNDLTHTGHSSQSFRPD